MPQHKYWVRPCAVAIPENMECWSPEVAEHAGQIMGIYVFDEASVTYLCSPEAMFWLVPIDVYAQHSSARERFGIDDEIMDDEGHYFSVKYIERLKPWYKYPAICPEHFTDECREKAWEEALEKAQVDPPYLKSWDKYLNPAP